MSLWVAHASPLFLDLDLDLADSHQLGQARRLRAQLRNPHQERAGR